MVQFRIFLCNDESVLYQYRGSFLGYPKFRVKKNDILFFAYSDNSGIPGIDPDVCQKIEQRHWQLEVSSSKEAYARANMVEYNEHDPFVGKAILQKHGRQFLLVNPPTRPLTTAEMDEVAELPYVREPHPMYDEMGGVPAI